MGKVSKYMCLGCWSSAGPARVVRADGQVLTMRKATTVGELLRRLKSGDCYYVCEASTPGTNSPLFPPPPPARMADNPLFAPASPVQGGPSLPLDAKLQRGHLYFVLPLPLPEQRQEQEQDQETGASNLHSYGSNSLSNLLRRSSGEDLSGLQRSRRGPGSSNQGGSQGGALKSAIARRISTKISPELGTAFDTGSKPGPAHHLVYELLTKHTVVQSGSLKPVMRSWQDRPANASPAKFARRRRRSLRTYSGSWKPELPIISEDGTLASCLCPAMLSSDTDDDSITMLPTSPSATVPACGSPSAMIFRLSKSPRNAVSGQASAYVS